MEDVAGENIGYKVGTWLGHVLLQLWADQNDAAAADGTVSTLTKSAGRGCKGFGGQPEAVQFSYTPCTSLTLFPFFPGSLLKTSLPALYRYCINIRQKVAHSSKWGFLKHFHD